MAYSPRAKYGKSNRKGFVHSVGFAATVLCAALACVPALAQSNSFGPIRVPGTAVIWDPDGVLTAEQLIPLNGGGVLHATPAVQAMSFPAAAGQTMAISASGQVGCCGVAQVGPDGYPGDRANITSLGSISGFVSPNGLPLVGVFTNGSPRGAAPPPYDYSAGVGQATSSPQLNQVFILGDGLTGNGPGSQQTFNVPATATELWLGFPDAGTFAGHPGNYADNAGSLLVAGTLCPSIEEGGPITSSTFARVPGTSPSRACIGIGESVQLTSTTQAKWTIRSTESDYVFSGSLQVAEFPKNIIPTDNRPADECNSAAPAQEVDGTQACFTAPYKNATIVVTAAFSDGTSASKTFAVLQPTGLVFQRVQWPKGNPDYTLSTSFIGYELKMTSAVFLTPGNVSFANIQIEELDNPTPHYVPTFNWLFQLKLGNAWLFGCDDDIDLSGEDSPKTSPWVYADRWGAHKTQFSIVKTEWSNKPPQGYLYTKGQIGALVANGGFMLTPETPATAAILRIPENIPYSDTRKWPDDLEKCRGEIKDNFTLIP